MYILRNIKTKGSVWEDRRDYIRWANIASALRRSLIKIKPTLLSWNILGIDRLYARQQMSLLRKPQDKRAQARAALTDLFQSIKTEETPIIVEQVVNDIDNEVVNIVRQFNDAFQSVTARREIKKKLRAILWVKYQIKDNVVFERAYQYIEMYY